LSGVEFAYFADPHIVTYCSRTSYGSALPLEVYLVQVSNGAPSPVAWGLRCREALKVGQFVGVYLGLVGTTLQLDNNSEYQLSLNHFHESLSKHELEEVRLSACCAVASSRFGTRERGL
jgi:hypothetical protein